MTGNYKIIRANATEANKAPRTVWRVTNLDGYPLGDFRLMRDAEDFISNEEAADFREWLGNNPQLADAY